MSSEQAKWIWVMILLFLSSIFLLFKGDTIRKALLVFDRHLIYQGFRVDTVGVADFNRDGVLDVTAGGGKGIMWFDGKGWIPHEIRLEGWEKGRLEISYVKCLDLDSDGDQDIIACNYWGPLFWLECPERPEREGWNFHIIDDEVSGIHGMDLGDVDRDGKMDLVANSAQPGKVGESLVWYHIPPSSDVKRPWKRHILGKGNAKGGTHYPRLVDMDKDGDFDLVIGSRHGNWFAWWECPANPQSEWIKHPVAENEPGATNILGVDANGDGLCDLVASLGHSEGVFWYEAPSWHRHIIDPSIKGPHSLDTADFDDDGDMDVVSCGKDNRMLFWYENDGRGHFEAHLIFADQAAYDLHAVDLDQDGDMAILIGGEKSRNVVWYENRGRKMNGDCGQR